MELIQLELLQLVADMGNFQKAAEKKNLSVSNVRNHIRAVEKECGAPLFCHSGNTLKLNEEGELVRKYADRILWMTEDMRNHLYDQDDMDNMISCVIDSANSLILPLLVRFLEEYPNIKIKLLKRLPGDRNGELMSDIMIFISHEELHGKNYRTLLHSRFQLAVSSVNPLSRQTFLNLKDVKEEPFILPSKDTELRKVMDSCFHLADYSPRCLIEADNEALIHRLVASNEGITLAAPTSFRIESDTGIVLVPLRHPPCDYYVQMQWNPTGRVSRAAGVLRQYILDCFSEEAK